LGSKELLAESRRGTFAAGLVACAPNIFAAEDVFDSRGGLGDALALKLSLVFAFPSKPLCWSKPAG